MAAGENILGGGISSGQSCRAFGCQGPDSIPASGARPPGALASWTDARVVGAKREPRPGLWKSRDSSEEGRTVLKELGG